MIWSPVQWATIHHQHSVTFTHLAEVTAVDWEETDLWVEGIGIVVIVSFPDHENEKQNRIGALLGRETLIPYSCVVKHIYTSISPQKGNECLTLECT